MEDLAALIPLALAVIIMLALPIGLVVSYLRGNMQAVVILGFALISVILGWLIGGVIAIIVLIVSAIRGDWQLGGMAIGGVALGFVLSIVVGILGLSGIMMIDPGAINEITGTTEAII